MLAGIQNTQKHWYRLGWDSRSISPSAEREAHPYVAEARLLETLEEKHIDDDPERLSVEFESLEWNIGIVLSILVAAVLSGIPYIYLVKVDIPPSMRFLWVFPFLRTALAGSCFVAVSIQFIIQSRLVFLMRSRLVFMIMNRFLDESKRKGENPESFFDRQQIRWNSAYPAKECLWSLEQHLRRITAQSGITAGDASGSSPSTPTTDPTKLTGTQPNQNSTIPVFENKVNYLSLPIPPISFSNPQCILDKLSKLRDTHFPSSFTDRLFLLASWTLLLFGIPAIIIGSLWCQIASSLRAQ